MNDSYRLRRQVYMLLIVGAVAAITGRIFGLQQGTLRGNKIQPTFSSNDISRWATVRSLVDHGSYVVGQRATDPTTGKIEDTGIVTEDGWKTVDKVMDPAPAEDGSKVHYFYSSKPPLYPTLVAGEYWLLKQLGLSITSDLPWIVRIVLLTFNVLPFAFYLYMLGKLADQFGATDWARLLLVFAAGFATFVTTFSNTLSNHTAATFLALFGLVAFLRIWATPTATPHEAVKVAEKTAAPEPRPAEQEPAAQAEEAKSVEEPVAAPTEAAPPPEEEKPVEAAATAPADDAAPAPADEPEPASTAAADVFTSFRMTEAANQGESEPASSVNLPPSQPAGAGAFILAGLCSGMAAAFELPAASFAGLIFLLLLYRDLGRTLKFFLPPALLSLGLFLGTNYLAIGELMPVQGKGVKSDWYQFERSHWRQDPDKPKTGIDFADEPKHIYAMHFLIGHHGVFSLTPLFLLSAAGMVTILWSGRKTYGDSLYMLAGLTALLTLVVFAFYIWKTNNYAGFSSGPRWVMWLTPFWLLTMLPVADKLAGCRWGRSLALVLLFFSVLSASYPAWNPWQHPWIYQYVESLAWMKY